MSTDNELHSRRVSSTAGAEGAPLAGDGGAPIPFPSRRTYLDAAREQGVYNTLLELEDENARLKRGEPLRDERAEQLAAERAANPPISLAAHSERTRGFADALRERDAATVQRFQVICRAYQEAGFGDAYFRMLMTLLFDVAFRPEDAANLFQACRADWERQQHEEGPEQQFNATGIIGNSCRPTPLQTQEPDNA